MKAVKLDNYADHLTWIITEDKFEIIMPGDFKYQPTAEFVGRKDDLDLEESLDTQSIDEGASAFFDDIGDEKSPVDVRSRKS